MNKRQLKAKVNELETELSRLTEEIRESNEALKSANQTLEAFAYEDTVGPVNGDKLLALLVSISLRHGGRQCHVATLIDGLIRILPRYKLNKGDEQK